ncbi:MAG TPA: hypothetical protein VKG45_11870 [Actinomycetes bacterium]|nr:hypothetical protein [Actinomycetes bacterium]
MRDSPEDERLLDELRRVLDRTDPMPEQVTRAARESYTWRTVDAELAALAWDSDADRPLASVRGTGDARLLTFDAEGLRFDLEISGSGRDRRLVGQLVPAQPGEVELRQRSGLARTVQADDAGRFAIADLEPGPLSLCCRRPGAAVVATEWFLP